MLKFHEIKQRKNCKIFAATGSYYYFNYKKCVVDKSTIVPWATYSKAVKLFNEKMIELIINKLYVFKIPYGLGNLCVGEEVAIRKKIIEIYTNEKGLPQRRFVPNIGLKRTFRFWWSKQSVHKSTRNKELYWLYISANPRSKLGNYIQSRYDDSMQPNFRAYPILIN